MKSCTSPCLIFKVFGVEGGCGADMEFSVCLQEDNYSTIQTYETLNQVALTLPCGIGTVPDLLRTVTHRPPLYIA